MLGKWIESRKCREKIIFLTKCGDVKAARVLVNLHVIMEQLNQSLGALRVDSIDIYLLHSDAPNTPVKEFIYTLNEAKKVGTINVFSFSNWTHQRIETANIYAKSKGLAGFQVSSPNYGLALQVQDLWGGGRVSVSGDKAACSWYAGNQMPVIAYSSLGCRFFSGKFRAGDYEGARRHMDSFAQKGYLCEQNMLCLRRTGELAVKYGVSVPEIAMRYVFSNDMNIFAVVSTTSSQRLQMNINAANNLLSTEEAAYLEA